MVKPPSIIFSKLPVELILEIMDYLQTRDAISVLRTCQAMRTIVEGYLYKHIPIRVHARHRLSGVVRTLSKRPDLARRVITWDGYLFPVLREASSYPEEVPKLFFKRWWPWQREAPNVVDLTPTPFNYMTNLKSITIYYFGWLQSGSYPQVRPTLDAMSLTTLIIAGCSFSWPDQHPGYERELAMILQSQPLLERLELQSGKWDMEEWLSPTDLPHLHSLVAREEEARRLIPGRPITSLTLLEVDRVLDDNAWRELAASSTYITSLTFDVIQQDLMSPFLHSTAKYMEALEIICTNSLCMAHLGNVYENFPTFKRLRSLTVTLRRCWHNDAMLNDESLADLKTGVQTGSPSVKYVKLAIDGFATNI